MQLAFSLKQCLYQVRSESDVVYLRQEALMGHNGKVTDREDFFVSLERLNMQQWKESYIRQSKYITIQLDYG